MDGLSAAAELRWRPPWPNHNDKTAHGHMSPICKEKESEGEQHGALQGNCEEAVFQAQCQGIVQAKQHLCILTAHLTEPGGLSEERREKRYEE
ncbi:unnamed protein product [Merluccius merluccius]